MIGMAEYIWLDGTKPTQALRSKGRAIQAKELDDVSLKSFPQWSYDGSSTNQSEGRNSDLLLEPVFFCPDPTRGMGNFLVLCEVLNPDGTPHATNARGLLRETLKQGANKLDAWIGFEQEYTMMKHARPLGFPKNGYPAPQGPFYCAVGSDRIFGRDIVEDHLHACHEAELLLYGVNGEVMPGQWEYQIGYRGFEGDIHDILTTCDHAYVARWLLLRIAEEYEVTISFDNKPVKGDWNGSGCHTNFSTKEMRAKGGIAVIEKAVERLSKKHNEHIAVYGHALNERLTGAHETCSIYEFKSGVADRGASIRIPQQVKLSGAGYLEDRRPGSNICPYLVTNRLLVTIGDMPESLMSYSSDVKSYEASEA